jgi:restriction endonuclease S subunit
LFSSSTFSPSAPTSCGSSQPKNKSNNNIFSLFIFYVIIIFSKKLNLGWSVSGREGRAE